MTDYLFSCDWGTSSFRLCLVDLSTFEIRQHYYSTAGIGTIYKSLNDSQKTHKSEIYLQVVSEAIQFISSETNLELGEIPVIISGMASSTIGIEELPYSVLPFSMEGETMIFKELFQKQTISNPIILFSGVRSISDVMRGEETQLLGMIEQIEKSERQNLFYILPGTHSKHVTIENNAIVDFRTLMTGEVFATLSQHTILKDSILLGESNLTDDTLQAFEAGVEQSLSQDLLANLFTIRTNFLFGKYSKEENYFFFSGLMIGEELKSLRNFQGQVILGGANHLRILYMCALEVLGINYVSLTTEEMDVAVLKGQWKVYKQFKLS